MNCPYPFHLRMLAVLALTFPGLALAQSTGTASAALDLQRDQTRQRVEQVSSDRAKSSDAATSLGASLPSGWQGLAAPAKGPLRDARPAPVSAASLGLPDVGAPRQSTVVRRPVVVAALSNLSTPDFSRQTVTFAQLAGQPQVDMPEPEGSLGQGPSRIRSALSETLFGLPDLVGAGLDQSPELRASRSRQDSADYRKSKNRADLLPTFTARYADGQEASTNATLNNFRHDYTNQSLRLTQPLFNYPAWQTMQAARGTQQAAQQRALASEQDTALQVVQAVVNLSGARIALQFADEWLDNLSAILQYQEQRAQSGASSQADLERARSRVLAARQTRLELQASYKGALLEAERLLGFTPRLLTWPYLNQLPPLPRTQTEIREAVLQGNPEILALRREVEAQNAQVKAQYGRSLPTVVASLEDDRSTNNGGVMGQRQDKRALVVMNWALSLGGKDYFAGKEAGADLRELLNKLQDIEQRMTQAVDNDFALLQAATLRIGLGVQEQQSALAVSEAVREQLKAGRVGSLLEALDASERLYAARSRLAQALSQQMMAQAQLLKHMNQLAAMQEQALVRVQVEPVAAVSSKP